MFEILKKSISTGIVTKPLAEIITTPSAGRGAPDLSSATATEIALAQAACPTNAIDTTTGGRAVLDLAKCTFCGACADAAQSIKMTHQCVWAAQNREQLKITRLPEDGQTEDAGKKLNQEINRLFGRSLHIREVDAGSCNGCEIEIGALSCPIYDVERFGIHFVASPRHADMLLVTGPVTRNMELALKKTYDAMPGPRLVIAAGTCGCSGGIFGCNYATRGSVDTIIPVDVYIPGCPPSPKALLNGILMAIGKK